MTRPCILTEIPGPKSRSLARRLRRAESPNITFVSQEFPIFWESASGMFVTDADGNTFLDMTAAFGVSAAGHSNPRVVEAVCKQAARLMHGMGDIHPPTVKVELAEKLAALSPGNLSHVIFGSSGAEAVEAALKTAMLYTGRPGVLAFEGGYHGLTYGALQTTHREDFKAPFCPQLGRFTVHAPYEASFHDLSLIEQAIAQADPPIGAVLVEPIQGRGGILVPPEGWFTALKDLCACRNILLIADEIFTGFGRTGRWFASETPPDIICLGKAMTGGFPISACIAPEEIMSAWGESQGEAVHTSTFIGNPLGCAAALAALSEIEDRNLVARSEQAGCYFKARLEALQLSHPAIREVRGRGLMLGMELRPEKEGGCRASRLMIEALRRGLIVLPAGPNDQVLELVPPLIISGEEIDFAVESLGDCLQAVGL
ncbi:MAG: aspartate aminotransferase family protein [Armatimonadetes bacterium]|nr:aspartate aminotransferase family protein [Armatimonadota bacterium]